MTNLNNITKITSSLLYLKKEIGNLYKIHIAEALSYRKMDFKG